MDLNQVTILSTDVSKAIEFYQNLGLILIVHSNHHYARFLCPTGNTTFSIHQTEEMPTISSAWIYFECEELDAKVASLQQQGVVFEQLPQDQPWLWREARLKDLDGNQLILYSAGENRKNPPWRLPLSF